MSIRMLYVLVIFVFVNLSFEGIVDNRHVLQHDFTPRNEGKAYAMCPSPIDPLVICQEIIHGETAWANVTNCICPEESHTCIQQIVVLDRLGIARLTIFKCIENSLIFKQADPKNRGRAPRDDQVILTPDGTAVLRDSLKVTAKGSSKQGRRAPDGTTYFQNNATVLVPGIAHLLRITDVLGPDYAPIRHGKIVDEKMPLSDKGIVDFLKKLVYYPNSTVIPIVKIEEAQPGDVQSAKLHPNGTLILPCCQTPGVTNRLPPCQTGDFCKDNIYSVKPQGHSSDYFMCACPQPRTCNQKEGRPVQYNYSPLYGNMAIERQSYRCS